MKILFLCHRVPFPPNKGEKIRTFNQIKHLVDLKQNVHLFAPYEHIEDLLFFTELKEKYCTTFENTQLAPKWLRLISGLLKNKPLSVANFYSSALQKLFDNFIQTQTVDAIICSASSMAEYIFNCQALKKLKKKPLLIMDFMDVDSDKWQQYQKNSGFPMRWVYAREHKQLKRLERKIVSEFDTCYLIAQAEVELFNRKVLESDKVKVLGNGLDTESFYPPSTKKINKAPIFLFTGVMDYKPNVDAVVWFVENCWLDLLKLYPNSRFIIAGMNPSHEVSSLSKYPGIEITGFVENILPYYHMADIFVAPFRLARGVQNKILQAFSCGLPVVSTPMGAEGIICKPEVDILLATKPDEFIEQITRLLENTSLLKQIISNTSKLITEHYTWNSQLTPLINTLDLDK